VVILSLKKTKART